MKSVVIMSALVLSLGAAQAKTKKASKMSREDAKELCLTSKGASVEKKELRKCISKAMRTGKV